MVTIEQYGEGKHAWFDIRYNGNLILTHQTKKDVDDIIDACNKDNCMYVIKRVM